MDKRIEAFVREKMEGSEAEKAINFLNRGFSVNGQIAIASLFVFAREAGKTADEVLAACQTEWKKNWDFQHPELRGDPDAPGKAGLNNRISLEDIYAALGMPSPMEKAKS